MKCKVTYDTYCKSWDTNIFNGEEREYDEDGNVCKRTPGLQLYPRIIIVKDGEGICWRIGAGLIPQTRVPGECIMENISVIRDAAHGYKYSDYYKEPQRLAELLNTGDFKVVAVNFVDPKGVFNIAFHDIQIKSMEFYADNGKVLFTAPFDSFNYELKEGSQYFLLDDEGAKENVI